MVTVRVPSDKPMSFAETTILCKAEAKSASFDSSAIPGPVAATPAPPIFQINRKEIQLLT